jgi:hypothetical protein
LPKPEPSEQHIKKHGMNGTIGKTSRKHVWTKAPDLKHQKTYGDQEEAQTQSEE